MLSKKRGLESNGNIAEILAENNQTNVAAVADFKKPKVANLANVNIIDVISSEYFNSEASARLEKISSKENEHQSVAETEKITCNGVELVREKTGKPEFIYDLYYTKSDEIHLDLLYPNNFEIKSMNNFQNVDLVDDNLDDDCDGILFEVSFYLSINIRFCTKETLTELRVN